MGIYKNKINSHQLQTSIFTFNRLRRAYIKAINESDNEYLELPMPRNTEKSNYLDDAGHLLVSKAVWKFYQDILSKVKDKSLWKKGEREIRPNQYGLDAIILRNKLAGFLFFKQNQYMRTIYEKIKKCKDVGFIREILIDKYNKKTRQTRQVKCHEFLIADSESIIKFLDFHRKLGIQVYGRTGKQSSIEKKIKIKTGWKYGLKPTEADIKWQEAVNSTFASWLRKLFESPTDDKIPSENKRIKKMLADYDKIKWVHVYLNEIQRHGFSLNDKKNLVLLMPLLSQTARKEGIDLNDLFGVTDNPDSIFNVEYEAQNYTKARPKVSGFLSKCASKSERFLCKARPKVSGFPDITQDQDQHNIQAINCLNVMLGNDSVSTMDTFKTIVRDDPSCKLPDSLSCATLPTILVPENKRTPLFHISGKQGENNMKKKKQAKSGKKVYKTGEENGDMNFKTPIKPKAKVQARQSDDKKIDFRSERVQRGTDANDKVRGLLYACEVKKYDEAKEEILQSFLKAKRHEWFSKPEFLSKVALLIEAYTGPLEALMQQLEALDNLIKTAGGQSKNRGRILKAVERASAGTHKGKYKGYWYISEYYHEMVKSEEAVDSAVKKSGLLTADDDGVKAKNDKTGMSEYYLKSVGSAGNTSSGDKTAHERTTSELGASCEEADDEK